MLKEEAADIARKSSYEKHMIRDTWYCGIINRKIEQAAREGKNGITIRFSSRSYVAKHQTRFLDLYEKDGYQVSFRPNYVHIAPSMWDMVISW